MLYILPESDTTALPIEPGNDHTIATVKVIDLEDGTFLWTVPYLPELTIEWRKAEISWNGVVKKALVRASDQSLDDSLIGCPNKGLVENTCLCNCVLIMLY